MREPDPVALVANGGHKANLWVILIIATLIPSAGLRQARDIKQALYTRQVCAAALVKSAIPRLSDRDPQERKPNQCGAVDVERVPESAEGSGSSTTSKRPRA